jgi:hypothetical protein
MVQPFSVVTNSYFTQCRIADPAILRVVGTFHNLILETRHYTACQLLRWLFLGAANPLGTSDFRNSSVGLTTVHHGTQTMQGLQVPLTHIIP